MTHTEPLSNDATGVYELRHATGAVEQAFAGQENALPLVQHNFRRTIADASGLAFAHHHICDSAVLFRAGFYQPALDAAARFARLDGVARSSGKARASGRPSRVEINNRSFCFNYFNLKKQIESPLTGLPADTLCFP